MEISDSRMRSRQLNAQLMLKRQEEQIRSVEKARHDFQTRNDAVMPIEFAEEFERRFIRSRDHELPRGRQRIRRLRTIWNAAQKMVLALRIEPAEWFYHSDEIYDYFYGRRLSLYYLHAILKMANLWGFFISRKLARPFLPVPAPRGYERQRLLDTFYLKANRKRPSGPLTPQVLTIASKKLNRANFNWLYLTVWFGLRPQEVDNLRRKDTWAIEASGSGRRVLHVFQTKLAALPLEDRWKPIPILHSEQEFGLRIIANGIFKRPLLKTIRKHFGPKVSLYGGRKGFTDLMLSKGNRLENISIWMGHSSIDRTWRSYKNKRTFHL